MNKRYLLGAGALAALVLGVTAVGVNSQPANSQQPAPTVYYTKSGDTAWDLAKIVAKNPLLWTKVVEYNPYLKDRVSKLPNGDYHVLLYPGDPLYNLDKLGINLSDEVVERPPTTIDLGPPPPKAPTESTWFERNLGWLLGLLALAAVVATGLLLRRRRRERLDLAYRDPVGSGPAMVENGVTDDTVAQVFAERGRSRDFTIVGDVVRGRGYGEMSVRYADNREERRMLDGHVVYQATVRFVGANADEQIFMLQGCGNDIRFGNFNTPGKMFRFVADEVVAPAPQPTVEPEAAAPAPVIEAEPLVKEPDDELKIELKPAATPGDTAMVRVTGAPTKDMVLTVSNDSLTLRFHPKD